LQTHLGLFGDDFLDFPIFDLGQLPGGYCTRGALGPRLLQCVWPKETADHVGPKRRFGSLHVRFP
jgi:hypothetical protein